MVSMSPRLLCSSEARLSGNDTLHELRERGTSPLIHSARQKTSFIHPLPSAAALPPGVGLAGPGLALTAPADVEDEVPLDEGAAPQLLCCLRRIDGLGAHLALLGTQPLALVAEHAVGRVTGTGCEPANVPPPCLCWGHRGPPHLLSFLVYPEGHSDRHCRWWMTNLEASRGLSETLRRLAQYSAVTQRQPSYS